MFSLEVHEGDITQFQFDALVNAANNHLWMGGGVAGALKRAGGWQIEDEAVKKGPIAVGAAIATGAGKLQAKYIIHAAVMAQDLRTSAEKIRQATQNSLLLADQLGIKSIGFPALGTGVGGFPLAECARVMITTVQEYRREKTGLEKVAFILYGESAYRVFRQELDRQTT